MIIIKCTLKIRQLKIEELLKVIDETFGWLLAVESILWRCVVKVRIIFLSRQTFLISQKHISTLSYARNITRKNKWRNTSSLSLTLLFFYSFHSRWISSNKGEKTMKRRRVKTIMFFDDVHIRSQLPYKNFTFCQKTVFWK